MALLPDRKPAYDFVRRLTPRWTKYIRGAPSPKQHLFLALDNVEEMFFGGAAGPGKSWALLAGALQYVDRPNYDALLIRKNFPDLSQPGGLIDTAHDWLDGTDAKWNEQSKRFYFPAGSILQFGHMDNRAEIARYKGSEFQYIGIDETTDLDRKSAMFLHSRLRRRVDSDIPLRFRCASNPGGPGHEWVRARYVDYVGDDRVFIPATLNDNPFLDREAYARSLDRLDPITRERLLRGDWTVTDGGQLFNRSWFSGHYQDAAPILVGGRVRAWDLAATVSDTSKETAGVLMSRTVHGLWVVEDVIHGKWHPGERDAVIVQTAELDGQGVKVILEEEPGSGGKAQNEELIRKLAGYRVESVRVTGEKFVRAGAFASQCQAGNVNLVRGPWVHAYVEQLHSANPELVDDILLDMMDASSLAFNMLVKCSLNPMAVETPPRGMRYSPTQSDEREEVEARKEDALIERLRERRGLYDRVMDPGDDVFGDKELFL